MTDFQPERLESARSIRGWSKKELAEHIGVSPGSISHYEGRRSIVPSREVLQRLAKALWVDVDFFFSEPLPETGGVFWRRVSRTPASLRRRYEHLARLVGQALQELGTAPCGDAPALDLTGLSPEEAALAVRAACGFKEDESIWSAVDVLERFGLWTHELELSDSLTVDACSTRVDGRAIAFLNPAKADGYRTRYTSLHELYHMLVHSEPATNKEERIVQERDANLFASELLLPARLWADLRPRKGLNNPWSYLKFKGRFGISIKALMYKTKGYMSDSEYRYGMMRYSQLGWNQSEPRPNIDETAVEDDRPRRGYWLLEQFGSVHSLASALSCDLQLAKLLVNDDVSSTGPNLVVLEGGERFSSKKTTHLRVLRPHGRESE